MTRRRAAAELHVMRRLELVARSFHPLSSILKEATVRISSSILSVVASVFVLVGANAQVPAAGPGEFVLRVDSQGFLSATVEGTPLQLDEAAVRERASVALRSNVNATFAVEADAAAPSARVTQAAQLLQQAGVTRIDFRTSRAEP
jgi:biopolymer transport protein ExbD